MTNISSEVRNYFKLELLISRSCNTLRNLFKARYSLFNNGQAWAESPTCGNSYLTNVVAKNKNINLTPAQKTSVSKGNTDEWDISTLCSILLFSKRPQTLNANEEQQLDEENKLVAQLRDARNKLVHHSSKSIHNQEFNQLWIDISTILVTFGDIETELAKLKEDSIFDSPKQVINEENTNEALRLKSLGNEAYDNEDYSEAIKFFIKATVLPGVSDHDRAIFFRIWRQVELDRALKDAKQARKLWLTWWKAHYRVGQVYAVLDDHEKAINSFERAFALDPTKQEIQTAMDESRIMVHRDSQQEDLDLCANWKPMHECPDAEMIRKNKDLLALIDPSVADVTKGHQFALGDIDIIQDYEQAAKYFAKAANADNAEGMYNLARLFDKGLGVKKD
ncbi:unnamed protein product, partial [Adineta ricciae]